MVGPLKSASRTPAARPERARARARPAVTKLFPTALAAQDRHHPPYASEPVGDAAPLGHDLVDEARAVGVSQLVIGADVQGHSPKRCLTRRHDATLYDFVRHSVVASCNAIFSLL